MYHKLDYNNVKSNVMSSYFQNLSTPENAVCLLCAERTKCVDTMHSVLILHPVCQCYTQCVDAVHSL